MLNGTPTTLVGIMPKRFTKRGADIWYPVELDRADTDRWFIYQGRLKPGVTLKQVEADLLPIAQRWAKDHPKDYPKRFSIEASSYVDSIVGPFRKTLFTLGAAVALLLLIACANVANMLLARSTARDREMAIRAALGASRWRVVRQLLMESVLLALGGTVIGCGLAYTGVKALVAAIPDGAIPQGGADRVGPAGVGVQPGTDHLHRAAFRTRTGAAIGAAQYRRAAEGFGSRRQRRLPARTAAECAGDRGAGALAGAADRRRRHDADLRGAADGGPGIQSAQHPGGAAAISQRAIQDRRRKAAILRPVAAQIEGASGSGGGTETSTLPPYGGIPTDVDIAGKTHADRWQAIYQLVSEGYCRTLGARLLHGRLMEESEVAGARKVAVVNQTLVAKWFGKEDPIGRQIEVKHLGTIPNPAVANPVFEIVGVISDMKNSGIQDPVRPEIMVPYTVTGAFERGILVRTAGNPVGLLNPVRREIWAVDKNVALTMTRTLDDFLSDFSYAQPRFLLAVLGVFAGVGLVLVAVGVYSVIAYTVSRQTHEIGIRMALGASRGDVIGMVLRMGMWLVAIGLAVGLAASLAANRVLSSELWGVSARDPLTFAAVALVVLTAGIAACWFPARRATRVDPMIALRFE